MSCDKPANKLCSHCLSKLLEQTFLGFRFLFVPHSWVSGLTQQAIAQLIGDPRYLRFNVFIREDANGSPFTDVNAKAVLSPQLF